MKTNNIQDFLILKNDERVIAYTKYGKSILESNLKKYVKNLCLDYGSSFDGRCLSFKFITNTKYKVPLVLSNNCRLYFLLTKSLDNKDCTLINYNKLAKFKEIDRHHTLLVFKNGYEYIIDENVRIIKRQYKLMNDYIDRRNENIKAIYS